MTDDDFEPASISLSDEAWRFVDALRSALARGDCVESAVGSFALHHHHGYSGVNPRNGEAVPIRPKGVVHWVPPSAWGTSAEAEPLQGKRVALEAPRSLVDAIEAALRGDGRAEVRCFGRFVRRRDTVRFQASQVFKGALELPLDGD